MNRFRILAVLALAAASSQAADIVLTPPPSGGVRVTNSAGDVTLFRIFGDGTLTFSGDLFRGSDRFLHAASTNTFLGVQAGNFTTTGTGNTACGYGALSAVTFGSENTALGRNALNDNTEGAFNTAVGRNALLVNTTGSSNMAIGGGALSSNTTGEANVAAGLNALRNNTAGSRNTAVGLNALGNNTVGSSNTAFGDQALSGNSTGTNNTALGEGAGSSLTTGIYNIAIGHSGVAAESRTIRIGTAVEQTRAFIAGVRGVTTGSANAIAVMVDSNGQLGTVSSSGRFKDDIADMDEASSALMKLRPVTFHYKDDQDPEGRTLQYGLVAEEVAEVYPGLVARTPDGQAETVMYQFLPAMLLNEVQKLQREVAALRAELHQSRRQP